MKALLFVQILAIMLMAQARATPDADQKSQPPSLKYKLDGSFVDWKTFQLGWLEDTVGFEGISREPRGKGIAFKGCYFDNDQNYLYIFYICTPTLRNEIERHHSEHGKSSFTCHGLGSLWIDEDNDVATGTPVSRRTQDERVPGAELYIQLSCGIFWQIVRGQESYGNCLDFDIKSWDSKMDSFGDAVCKYSSRDDAPLIGHGANGIEMAIPLKDLHLKKGNIFMLSTRESNGFTRRTKIEIK